MPIFPLNGKLYKACKEYIAFVDALDNGHMEDTQRNRREVLKRHGLIRYALARFNQPNPAALILENPLREFTLILAVDGENVATVTGTITLDETYIGKPWLAVAQIAAALQPESASVENPQRLWGTSILKSKPADKAREDVWTPNRALAELRGCNEDACQWVWDSAEFRDRPMSKIDAFKAALEKDMDL